MRRELLRIAACGAILVMAGSGQFTCMAQPVDASPERQRSRKLWVVSIAALVAANAFDAATSAGRYELNPTLRDAQGRYSATRGILIKSAASGGALLVQCFLSRSKQRRDMYRPAAIINLAAAAAVGGMAYSNSRLPKAQPLPPYIAAR